MKKYAIILAGGEGRRAGGSVPKQMLDLCGHPVLWWSMHAFMKEDPAVRIILVMHPGLFDDWEITFSSLPESERIPHTLCCGGMTRTDSVANAMTSLRELLKADGIDEEDAIVAVHDAARPIISHRIISDGWRVAAEGAVGVPVVPCSSSLREISGNVESGDSGIPVDRNRFREVQTPQTAPAKDILKGYADPPEGSFTDDASLLQAAGCEVRLFDGSPLNMKITYPLDIRIASVIMESE